jgi:hypothetical protein
MGFFGVKLMFVQFQGAWGSGAFPPILYLRQNAAGDL